MNWKKWLRRLCFPHPGIIILLTPLAALGLIYSFTTLDEGDARSIVSYVLSFYTLMILCLRTPEMWAGIQKFRRENQYYRRYTGDVRLRMNISLWAAFTYNAAYAIFQWGLGLYHHSAWFYAMAGYYSLLAGLRLMLGRHVRTFAPGAEQCREWRKYRRCGAGLLAMNLALSVFVLYFIGQMRLVRHHEITVIAMAAYTFGALALAIANVIRYRRYESPVCSAAKALSLASAAIAMLSLEDAMLTTFDKGHSTGFKSLMLGMSGLATALVISGMAVYMIIRASKNLKSEQE